MNCQEGPTESIENGRRISPVTVDYGRDGTRKITDCFNEFLGTYWVVEIWGRRCNWIFNGVMPEDDLKLENVFFCKGRSWRSWYWTVLQGERAEHCTRWSPGIAVRQRFRLKTPPLRVFTAAARKLAPKTSIVWDSSTPEAENKTLLRKGRHITLEAQPRAHKTEQEKKVGASGQQIPPNEAGFTNARETGCRLCAVTKEQLQLRIFKTPLGRGKPIGCARGTSRTSKSVSQKTAQPLQSTMILDLTEGWSGECPLDQCN